MLVFVYGTLLDGHGNTHVMREARGTLMGTGRLMGARIHSVGAFPALIRPSVGAVLGELYMCDDHGLAVLDALESEGSMYKRELCAVDVLLHGAHDWRRANADSNAARMLWDKAWAPLVQTYGDEARIDAEAMRDTDVQQGQCAAWVYVWLHDWRRLPHIRSGSWAAHVARYAAERRISRSWYVAHLAAMCDEYGFGILEAASWVRTEADNMCQARAWDMDCLVRSVLARLGDTVPGM